MTKDTPLRDGLINEALVVMSIGAFAVAGLLLITDGAGLLVPELFVGVACAMLPIRCKARDNPPRILNDVLILSRTSTVTFVLWLGVMLIYLVNGMPMGPLPFHFVVAVCVIGLLVSRVVFPASVVALTFWYGPVDSRG